MRERINAKIRNACTLHKTQGAWNISSLFGMDGDGNHEDVPVLGDPPRPVDDHDVQHEANQPNYQFHKSCDSTNVSFGNHVSQFLG